MEIGFLRLCGESEQGIPRIGRRTLFRAEDIEEFSETVDDCAENEVGADVQMVEVE